MKKSEGITPPVLVSRRRRPERRVRSGAFLRHRNRHDLRIADAVRRPAETQRQRQREGHRQRRAPARHQQLPAPRPPARYAPTGSRGGRTWRRQRSGRRPPSPPPPAAARCGLRRHLHSSHTTPAAPSTTCSNTLRDIENRGRRQRRHIRRVCRPSPTAARTLLVCLERSYQPQRGPRIVVPSCTRRWAASSGKCSPDGYGYRLMPWNGSGSTVCENAVLASRSFAHPSTFSRKSRVQPAGGGARERVELQRHFVARAHEHQLVVHIPPAVPAHRHSACTSPASDSRTIPATPGRRKRYRVASAPDRSSIPKIPGNADPRATNRVRPKGSSRANRSLTVAALNPYPSRDRQGAVAAPPAFPRSEKSRPSTHTNRSRCAPRRLAEIKCSGTAMVLGLPAGMPMSSFTVTHRPRESCICRYGMMSPPLRSCGERAERAAIRPVHPAVQQQHGIARRRGP